MFPKICIVCEFSHVGFGQTSICSGQREFRRLVVRLEARKILRSAGFVAILMLLGGIYALALANTITTG